MEHIKTLVQICDSEFTNLYYVRDAEGDRITTKLPLELAREIATVLNEHDKLVEQKAALVEALEPFEKLARAVERVPFARFGTVYEFDGVAITVPDLARVIAALALVRGKTE